MVALRCANEGGARSIARAADDIRIRFIEVSWNFQSASYSRPTEDGPIAGPLETAIGVLALIVNRSVSGGKCAVGRGGTNFERKSNGAKYHENG